MLGKDIIIKIIKDKGINQSAMARALEITRQNLFITLNTETTKDTTVTKLVAMANYLDYDVMLVPKSISDKTKGYIVTRGEE